jgi:hypothetical protein
MSRCHWANAISSVIRLILRKPSLKISRLVDFPFGSKEAMRVLKISQVSYR